MKCSGMGRAATKSDRKKTTGGTAREPIPGVRFVDGDHLVLRRGGKAVGVVISIDELRYFQELEDRLDVRKADTALAEPRRTPYGEVRLSISRRRRKGAGARPRSTCSFREVSD